MNENLTTSGEKKNTSPKEDQGREPEKTTPQKK